ncbi:CehA/McbA family metallohydrolase [Inquilinus sp.]|uniref:CehA/McbA family metallohydrolase n=1 Tax=Inquilinus sp. TaxID=1932117 RepID=UPI00378336C8
MTAASGREQVLAVRVTAMEGPYRPVPVEIPPGTTRINVAMAYAKAGDCIIDLGLLDPRATAFPSPDGFRGWSGGARDGFFVATDDATPGYVPGPMPAGTWTILLGLYRLPPDGAEVTLTIRLDDAARPDWSPEPAAEVQHRSPGWYRGDLHCHTHHSDARGAPEVLHEAARQAGLRFLAVTDHNTTTQRRYFAPRSSKDLVFIRGEEITTAEGHANVFGAEDWIDFRMTAPADAHRLAAMVHRAGGLLSINHDKPPIPWLHELPMLDCMEVWQSHWFAGNWVSLARYDERLRAGWKISLIGGSDWHQPAALAPPGPLGLGRPTTALWLPELSERAVLRALRAGRGYVTEGPDGPHLSVTTGGVPMGSTRLGGPDWTVEAEVRGAAGDRLVWVDAGGTVAEQEIPVDNWIGRLTLPSPDRFLRAEIVAVASRPRLEAEFLQALNGRSLPAGVTRQDIASQPLRRALSNPVYVGSSVVAAIAAASSPEE